ncbi:MAG: YkvA family protein [Lysobacterales bacterium]|jgi:uncharacterized membrane protein YkvA (DUF1232 family)
MPLLLSLNLSDSDLGRFRDILQQACARADGLPREQVIAGARQRLEEVRQSDAPDFVRRPMERIGQLLDMLSDADWDLPEDDADRVLSALAYFSDPQDLIPDNTPIVGFLDDAIMVEIVCAALEHEIRAYQDFVEFRANGEQAHDQTPTRRADWLEVRRRQLHERMRRLRDGKRAKNTKSPFSLF